MHTPSTEELQKRIQELEADVDLYLKLYREAHLEAMRAVHESNQIKGKGTQLTAKQSIMHQLVLSTHGAFPHMFSAKARWDRAEELYQEGLDRGFYPKETA